MIKMISNEGSDLQRLNTPPRPLGERGGGGKDKERERILFIAFNDITSIYWRYIYFLMNIRPTLFYLW